MQSWLLGCATFGQDRFDLRALPKPMRQEIAYAIQCRADERRTITRPHSIRRLLRALPGAGVTSRLELSPEAWTAYLGFSRERGHIERRFLLDTIGYLRDVVEGSAGTRSSPWGRRAGHAERARGPFFVAQKGHHAMTKTVAGLIVAVLLGCIGVPMLLSSAVLGGSGGCTPAVPSTSGQPGIGRWDREQVSIAATIVRVGVTKGVPRWGWVVALATAMQESQLRNLPHLGENNDHDSIGVFQQRPSQGWGTAEQLADPAYQAGRFYDKLLTVPGWEQMRLTDAAQRVQVSAYPLEYAKWTGDAVQLADDRASANASAGTIGYCGATGSWTQPVHAAVVSGFRTDERPGHDGVDLAAAPVTPIRAASAGIVVRVRCDIEPASYGCDRNGSPSTPGCGYYVDIEHTGMIYTRYCHMLKLPDVAEGDHVVAGQVIGLVGSSGHSSGPHLHFEVHLGDQTERTATDPVSFMAARGAPLGTPVG